MIHKIYSIYDSKAEAYLQPFFMIAKGSALRAITDLANDPSHAFCKHAEDYSLFELGSFDDGKAFFQLHDAPVSMGVLIEFKHES